MDLEGDPALMWKLTALKSKTYVTMSRQHSNSSWEGLKISKNKKVIKRDNEWPERLFQEAYTHYPYH